MTEDRQTNSKALDFGKFGKIRLNEKYGINEPLSDFASLLEVINKIIIDSYDEIKDEYDIERVKEINLCIVQNMDGWAPYAELKMNISTWETKNEMYNRRSYDKRQLEEKTLKLEKEAGQLGYKLEKINE